MSASLFIILLITLGALATSLLFLYGAYQLVHGRSANILYAVREKVTEIQEEVVAVGKELVATTKELGPRLKTLMYGWEFPPFNSGGLGVACLGLTRGLARQNTDVTFVLPKKLPVESPYLRVAFADVPEVRAHAVNSPLSPYAGSESYAKDADGNPLYGTDLVSEVRRYGEYGARLATREHDVIYAHDWLSFPAGIKAKRATGRPLVAHVHATEFDRVGEHGVNQAIYDIEREGLHASDRVIAVSERTKRTIVERYGVPAEKVSVVHNGIDEVTAAAPSGTDRLNTLKAAGYQIVLFLGRLTMQKGGDYFISAARKVLATHPKTYFVIAGAGDMERQLIEQAAAEGISANVIFAGFLRGEEQADVYAAADVFVMPSVSEPFGITALEAMRLGTPVIISKQSGVAEVAPGALQVDFWDTAKMAECISSVLSDPELRERLVKEGKETADRMTWERAAGQVRSILDELREPALT